MPNALTHMLSAVAATAQTPSTPLSASAKMISCRANEPTHNEYLHPFPRHAYYRRYEEDGTKKKSERSFVGKCCFWWPIEREEIGRKAFRRFGRSFFRETGQFFSSPFALSLRSDPYRAAVISCGGRSSPRAGSALAAVFKSRAIIARSSPIGKQKTVAQFN